VVVVGKNHGIKTIGIIKLNGFVGILFAWLVSAVCQYNGQENKQDKKFIQAKWI